MLNFNDFLTESLQNLSIFPRNVGIFVAKNFRSPDGKVIKCVSYYDLYGRIEDNMDEIQGIDEFPIIFQDKAGKWNVSLVSLIDFEDVQFEGDVIDAIPVFQTWTFDDINSQPKKSNVKNLQGKSSAYYIVIPSERSTEKFLQRIDRRSEKNNRKPYNYSSASTGSSALLIDYIVDGINKKRRGTIEIFDHYDVKSFVLKNASNYMSLIKKHFSDNVILRHYVREVDKFVLVRFCDKEGSVESLDHQTIQNVVKFLRELGK